MLEDNVFLWVCYAYMFFSPDGVDGFAMGRKTLFCLCGVVLCKGFRPCDPDKGLCPLPPSSCKTLFSSVRPHAMVNQCLTLLQDLR